MNHANNIKNVIKSFVPVGMDFLVFDNVISFEVPSAKIIQIVSDLYENPELSLKLITATDERSDSDCFKVWYVFTIMNQNISIVPFIRLQDTEEFPALSPTIHEAWDYERKIRTFFGLIPVGNPDDRPIMLQGNWPQDVFPLRKDFDWRTRPELAHNSYQFQKVEGEGIYEIPVGPIHAGIIEPGHFRFSVAGEEIMLLEPLLGFTHKGSEKLLEQLSLADKIRLSEKISGDSSFNHSLAFCQALEQLAGVAISDRVRYLRVLFAELERLANHFGNIGAIMLDAGFSFGGASGASLREMIMQINEGLSGNRFLRGLNVIGGVTRDISAPQAKELDDQLTKIVKDFSEVITIAGNSASLFNRLERTGTLKLKIAQEHGVIGIPARALGLAIDARLNHPYAAYDKLFSSDDVALEHSGDVYARFHVRIKEAYTSIKIIKKVLQKIPTGSLMTATDINFKKNSLAIGSVEGWRGEIVYFVTTDSNGNISRVFPRDPSFINWTILGHAGPGNIVPDFPLINKSFNLSYSGNDL
ncbi:hypothetical protein COT98_01710 [Candidatus Falkowbacteria bacterium CG10_big_fil_rev_8_21_14_0_10_39_9]|uniref:NADH-quinone oxidoreductase subunit F n=1 Tax=Candidatus Falkowbacteria bacterium CG10_big_fil_rev_8_21_14_0_10_39_9 TaxID=1974566 RepID=A0A2M6WQ30_9BACT|nr:MAG: hypothetical protein COT98_01710 [Candidatus Falkowbacteria bacterium CG10_big_fil_rev_8_21_14_0_10_39_9]